jgi:hypothetical protein
VKQVKSYAIGCGGLLITLGLLGLLSMVLDLGTSRRAIWVLFMGLANSFGSVLLFSILTIFVGGLLIAVVFLIEELRKPG